MTQEQAKALKPGDRITCKHLKTPATITHLGVHTDFNGWYTLDRLEEWELVKPQMNWYDAMKAVTEGKIVRSESLGLTVMLRNGETHKRVGKYDDCYWLKYCTVNAADMETADWEVA